MNKPHSGIAHSCNRYGIIDTKQTNILGNQSQSERSKFPPYWNEPQIQSGLAEGRVVSAQVRINPKKYTDAYASHPKGDADIFIPGTRARNRSLNGDLVYIKIEPLSCWRVYDSFISKKLQEWASEHHKRSTLNSPYVTVSEFIQHDPECFSKLFKDYSKVIKKNLDSFRDPPIPENFLKDLSWWQIVQRVGRVVGLRKQLNCRIGMGYLRPQPAATSKTKDSRQELEKLQTPDSEAKPTITKWNNALFVPIDSRMPRVIIPKSNCPEEFVRQPETFKFVRFVAVITNWPDDSLFARGHLIRKFDDESHSFIDSETERILVNAGFAYGLDQCMRFPEFVESHVAKQLIPSITPEVLHEEISRRRDFRSECVFTIDPRTARDLDDALHIKLLSREDIKREADLGFTDVTYEVGVHIADVSYYVRPEDPVDLEAANRATSIYLIQLCVPMLPRQLCEDLCSLHPGSDKLTFSVVFRLTSDGQVVSKWIGRTVINSRAKLSYEDAQAFIDEPERDWQPSDLQDLKSGTDVKEICRCVNVLNELAVKMRSRRFEGGALQLNQVKPTFTLSKETGEPIGLAPFIVRPANRLVEEWMLAANEAVALLLSKNLPQTAFLRRHPPPSRKQLREARTVLDFCDVDVNVSSAQSIQIGVGTSTSVYAICKIHVSTCILIKVQIRTDIQIKEQKLELSYHWLWFLEFVRQPETFKFVRFVAVITNWPDDSLFARGHLIRKFDDESHSFIDSETERILVNAGFAYGLDQCMRFPEFVESHVAKQLIPSITPEVLHEEISRRRDFRSECVFTIDPRTARDLDDALHIKLLSREDIKREADLGFTDVTYEVGVHIADVSYYVRPEDPVDLEAANRATSIYLIQLCVPMLPRQLCEDLCSLHPGSDKLTFSVVFRLTSDGQVVSKWIGRTVINSRAKLSYEDAQAFIDEPERDWQPSDLQDLKSGTDVKEICRCVNVLNELAVKMRSRRFEGGALQLNQVKPTFTLSKETGEPIGLAPFIVRPANRLVEEWMLAANEAVALLLSKNLPQTAFLRRHPPPSRKQLREARTVLDFCDVDVNVSSAQSIQESLNKLAGSPKGIIWQHSDDLANLCASMMGCSVDPGLSPSKCATSSQKAELEQSRNLNKEAHLLATLNVLTKCMNLAEYFCLGQPNGSENADKRKSSPFLGHYALNMTHYTHFTSPIRRYADLIVHRQIAQILADKAAMLNLNEVVSSYRATSKSVDLYRPDKLAAIADVCNARKLNSRKASEDSVELFFTVFVKECGPLIEACSVINMLDRAFDVLILSTGLVRRVYLNKLDLVEYEFEKLAGSEQKGVTGIGVLHLRWKVHPLKSTEKSEEGEPSFDLTSTDPAVKESVAAPPCNCFRQEIHLFDLVRCSVSVEGLNELEDGTAAVSVCKSDADTLNSSKLDESSSILETSVAKPQQSGGEISDQTLNLRMILIRPTCELCKNYTT
nr:dis3 exonuclease 2 [Hymenolepis microstoma]